MVCNSQIKMEKTVPKLVLMLQKAKKVKENKQKLSMRYYKRECLKNILLSDSGNI